jgi:hypothetical protein
VTTPKQAKKAKGGGRRYAWPPHPPYEFEVMSVTSAISGGLPKPYLIGWAAKMTAQAAVDDLEIVNLFVAKDDKRAAVDHLKGARYRDMNTKADRGTIVHAAVDAYLKGKPMTKEEMQALLAEANVPKSMWKSTAGMISGAMEFLFDAEPEVLWHEETVYSREHGYAGTPDLICRMDVGTTLNVPAVVDYKTSKSIYDEVALQLVAYARADFVGLDDGTEAQLLPNPDAGERIEHGVVVRPTASGTYERANFSLSDDLYDMFLACLAVATAEADNVLTRARRPGK